MGSRVHSDSLLGEVQRDKGADIRPECPSRFRDTGTRGFVPGRENPAKSLKIGIVYCHFSRDEDREKRHLEIRLKKIGWGRLESRYRDGLQRKEV